MRLDKYLANATDYSRAEIKKQIKAGEVTVGGSIASNPAQAVDENSDVILHGASVSQPRPRYFMLYKPAGYVSVTKDSEHPTAIDLLVDEPRSEQLQIAGRLDLDATGLLLITDDGQWNHALTSPKSQCNKTYRVQLAEPLADAEKVARKFADGVWLNNEKRRTQPAQLKMHSATEAELTISEGKYHQVKRMFAAMGNRVTALHRERIGAIVLDTDMEPGDYRPLTEEEINNV
ncbi:16S rRNA pseudouridine(516) synthase RsuA [Porticoccus sp. W117]|uniref:16S rRNA pseudouridine(516) synthase RsuA n=1 Tax=Porticoccus sp. W117 TaxID=3054777 RepID=UPI0025937AA5|nr:16S rRNA pseudouridine(516) synthase RsuA [Porticoccus sp. W117]MDM3870502.1 16S rRNA pseudouridine(516) synthase RsuA [Porticoccus sp. W117]